MKLYREVDTEEATHITSSLYDLEPTVWVAPYELPTEEEIDDIFDGVSTYTSIFDGELKMSRDEFKTAITKLIKGE